jgi:DNA-binding transcriptional LysR family regulator
MIDRLRALAIFSKVVETRSFRKAAGLLSLSPSVVSHHVTALEEELGVTLLYRSTRSVSLTDEGRKLNAAALAMLAAAEDGFKTLNVGTQEQRGALRISCPAFMTKGPVARGLEQFALRHPLVSLSISYSDLRHDLIREGFDLAIRMGNLKDSSLKHRKLGSVERCLVASPELINRHKQPLVPGDLERWNLICLLQRGNRLEFISGSNGAEQTIAMTGQVTVDSVFGMVAMARAGLGLALAPRVLVQGEIESGDLVQVLPGWTMAPIDTFAVWPGDARSGSLTARLVDDLVQVCGEWCGPVGSTPAAGTVGYPRR